MPTTTRAPQAPQPLKRGATNAIELRGLRDETAEGTTDEFPDDAVVTATLKDPAGVDVVGAIDMPLLFVPGRTRYESTYRGIIDSGVNLPGAKYFAHVTATANGGTGRFKIPCPVVD